ncbi:MAG: HAD-IIA family hydrolase [Thermoleophilia bacterium]
MAAAADYDGFLLDLDGVVFRGAAAIPGAVESLAELRRRGAPCAFVTNNASRTPDEVAALLRSLGVAAEPDEVVTAAVAGARALADEMPGGAPVLVVGGAAIETALREAGLRPVRSQGDGPRAVIQGWAPEVGWGQLAEAAYALADGVPWLATNDDASVPTERGLAPGNGALVAAVATATGRRPRVIGKPQPLMFAQAARRMGARRPLVIGDRLETDIAGAVRAGFDGALVLTGASSAAAARSAPPQRRPTHVWADLRGLLAD